MTGERRGMERRPSLHNIISCLPSTSGKSNKRGKSAPRLACFEFVNAATIALIREMPPHHLTTTNIESGTKDRINTV